MATQTDLYNGAARLLKERRFADITTDDVPLRYELDNVYADALAFMLEQGQWNFASRSASVAGSVSSNRGFSYRFTKPSDFVRLISISASASYYPPLETYDEDGAYWYCNETTVYVTYVSDHASYGGNLTLWPQTYAKAVEAYLAMEVGPHLTKSDELIARVAQTYEAALQLALAKDAINRTVRIASSGTLEIYKAVLRLVGARLTKNFDDKIVGRRIYDADGEAPTRQSQGAPASLPAYDAETEALLRRLLDESYDEAVRYLLEQGLWNFAMRTVSIESETDVEPAYGYSYTFEMPDDYIRLGKIADNGTLWPTLEDYLQEGNYWHANIDPLYVQYVSDGTSYGANQALWPATFRRALEAYLALEIAPHAPRMSGRGIDSLRERYLMMLRDARAKDAVNQAAERPPPGRLVKARLGNFSSYNQRRGTSS